MWQREMQDNAHDEFNRQFCELLTLQEEVHVMSISYVEMVTRYWQ